MKPILIIKSIAGFVALSLGFLGIFIPVLPTTPFVLLAIGCFSDMPRVRAWILKNSIFCEFYERYNNNGSISIKTTVTSLVFLWGMLVLSAFLVHDIAITAILFLVGAGVTLHILMLSRPSKNR